MFQLLEFLRLENDWDEDGSPAPSYLSILMALRLLCDLENLWKVASVYPSMDGGVLIEWRQNHWAYSLRLLNDNTLSFYGVDIESDEETDEITEKFVNFDEIKDLIQYTWSS